MASTTDRTWEVYTLSDPRDGRVRYVGVTCRGAEARLRSHLVEAREAGKKPRRCNWVRSLLAAGQMPDIAVIDTASAETWQERERHWIQQYREAGHDLVNAADGGQGAVGYRHTPEAREKMKGRVFSEETRAKLSAAHIGRPPAPISEDGRARLSAAAKGRKLTPEQCAVIGARSRGRHVSDETRAKIGAAHRGRRDSDETRAKRTASLRGRQQAAKRVRCIETGIVYRTAQDAAAALGRSRTAVYGAIRSGSCSAGLRFEYVDDAPVKVGGEVVARPVGLQDHRYMPLSDERKARIGAAHKGRTFSDETRAKMSDAHKGKTLSPETIAKGVAARTGKAAQADLVLCVDTGQTFPNTADAARVIGADRSSVWNALKHGRSILGYTFVYQRKGER